MLERVMKEIKSRSRKAGAFPNDKSCRRLIGAVLLEMQDKWDTEPMRYLVLD
jgi:transposase-like protein